MWLTAVGSLAADAPSYITARYVSCLFGVLTLVGVYFFARLVCNRRAAVFATAFLAISPYFLAFSKVAMTEGDVFLACASAWLMLALAYWAKSPNLGRLMLVAVAAGLMVGTKIVAAVWIPAILPLLFLFKTEKPYNGNQIATVSLGCMVMGLVILVYGFTIAQADHIATLNVSYDRLSVGTKIFHYLGVLVPWLASVGVAVRFRTRRIHPLLACLLVPACSLLTFFAIPPAHTTNGSLVQGVYKLFLLNSEALSPMVIYSAAGLNFLSVVIKNSPAVGVFLCFSVLFGFFFLKRQPLLAIILIPLIVYPVFLIINGRAQTFYMIGMMPQLAVLGAVSLNWLYERKKILAYGVVGICCANMAYDIALAYPDLHLNGYQYVGERYIAGRSSVGYKAIVQTPSDGTTQVMAWARKNVPAGDRVVTYIRHRMMIAGFSQHLHLPFHVRNGLDPKWDFTTFKWVITHINYMIDSDYVRKKPRDSIYDYRYFDMDVLQRDYEKVYSVRRAFGIEMATVWRRKVPFEK